MTFNRDVTIEDFLEHVLVKGEYQGETYDATLSDIGGGQIKAVTVQGELGVFRGEGDDRTYTYSDLSAQHSTLYSIEWVE